MIAVIVAMVWAGVVVYAITQARAVADQWLALLVRPVPATPLELVDVPEDLHAIALLESESWAQEDVLRVIREKYDNYHDWNRVRSAMGVGVIG